jgi:flagellar biogenesis protein FliO
MDFLFGSSLPLAARFFIAFLVVLALIGLTAWLVRRFGANRLGGVARGRQPRLAVIDAASVDGRRRLVLIRRDNTEHLLMIGGPSDVVVETNIVRASGATGVREPARVSMSTETTARLTNVEGSWPQSVTEPAAPIAPPRRSTATEEPWLPPEPAAPRARQIPADSLTGLAAELSSKFSAPEIAATREPSLREPSLRESMPRETMPRTTAAPNVAPALPETPPSPQSDRNLAEMAQQLEAALRRAPAQDSRPPVTDALAVPPTAKVSPRAAARDVKPRQESKIEPKFESKFDAKFESKFEPKFDSKVEPKREPKFEARLDPRLEAKPEAPTAPDKNIYDNLEEEMASLLGRPPEKS